jgi:hypothetical protein
MTLIRIFITQDVTSWSAGSMIGDDKGEEGKDQEEKVHDSLDILNLWIVLWIYHKHWVLDGKGTGESMEVGFGCYFVKLWFDFIMQIRQVLFIDGERPGYDREPQSVRGRRRTDRDWERAIMRSGPFPSAKITATRCSQKNPEADTMSSGPRRLWRPNFVVPSSPLVPDQTNHVFRGDVATLVGWQSHLLEYMEISLKNGKKSIGLIWFFLKKIKMQ